MNLENFIKIYLKETADIANLIDQKKIAEMAKILLGIKNAGGRIFFLGVGGGAGTGSHAANDFNKIAEISATCLTDNSCLLTALTNDEGWDSVFKRQLEMHKVSNSDCLFIYSVGGGTNETSKNLVEAINYAKQIGCKIIGVVGKDTGETAQKADVCVIVPCLHSDRRTAHTEDFQMIMDHLLVNLINQIIMNKEKNEAT